MTVTVRLPRWRVAALALLWIALAAARVGDPVADKAEAAREEYLKGQYGEALRLYREAQVEAPKQPALHFNVGDALVKTGDPAAALKEYEQALTLTPTKDAALRARTRFNMGNVFYGQQDFQQAAQAYREALEADSGDRDAKANLELVLQQLQQQQQQNQQNQQNQQGGSGQQGQSGQQQAGKQGERADRQDQPKGQDQSQPTPSPQNGQPDDRQQQASGMRQQGTDPGKSSRSGRLDREEAEQLLDALADRERQGQMRRLHLAGPVREKDW